MELKKQVVSLEFAEKLKALGVKRDSRFYWRKEIVGSVLEDNRRWVLEDWTNGKFPSAFTVAELGEMLPKEFTTFQQCKGGWHACHLADLSEYPPDKVNLANIEADTEADARAKMLIYLIEQGIITPTK